MMLEVEGVSCGYGSRMVVHDVSFKAFEGQKVCILGENGCGKSTLLKAIAGIMESDGSILVDGLDVSSANRREVARSVALLSQMSSVYFPYTVRETVMFGRYPHRSGFFAAPNPEDASMVEEAMRRCGVDGLKDRMISELSGGQLQRVFLARAFAQDPKIILLDEPTNHLDLKYQAALVDDLNEWVKGGERCVVGVFHDVNLAFSFADTIVLMHEGRVIQVADADEFDLDLLDEVYGMDVRKYMLDSLERWRMR